VVRKLLWIIYSLWGPMSTTAVGWVHYTDIHVVGCIECSYLVRFCCCQLDDTAFQAACRGEHIRIAEKLIRARANIKFQEQSDPNKRALEQFPSAVDRNRLQVLVLINFAVHSSIVRMLW
jgi:hypothetical protein